MTDHATVDPSLFAADLPQPTAADLGSLSNLVAAMVKAEDEVASLEAQVENAERRLRVLSDDQIPKLMEQCGVKLYVTADGYKVEVAPKIQASMPEHTRDRALAWLDENGHAGLIKRTVEVAFTREQEADAVALLKRLAETYSTTRLSRKVESSALSSWAKKELEAGHDLPDELFSIFRINRAKATPPKAK